MQYTADRSGTIHLGKQGEHRAKELMLPELTVWEAEHGPGEAEIIFLPPGEKEPVSITPDRREDGTWMWAVTALETACPGYGKCELRYTAGGAVVKSATYQTYVSESLGEGAPVPEMDPDDVQQKDPARMPLLTDEETGISYALMVEGGKLMLQEVDGDKKSIAMESDRTVPGGVATLDEDGILSECQRPDAEGVGAIPAAEKGKAGGAATLDGEGKLDAAQRPDYSIGQVTGLQDALDAKQTTLAFDEEPKEASGNPVISGGVYGALSKKQDTLTGAPGQLIGIGDDGAAQATVYQSKPNLLDNWYFVKPVNQRGVSGKFSTVGSYFIDRWVLISGSVEITDEGLKLAGTIEQRFEYTFGDDVTATALSTTGFVEAEYDNENNRLQITADGETIIAAKLELGPVQTLTHKDSDGNWVLNDPPPNKALELAKCQRYQYRLGAPNVIRVATGIAVLSTDIVIPITVPVSLRDKPTVSYRQLSDITIVSGGVTLPVTDITVNNARENCVDLVLKVSGATTGSAAMLRIVGGGHILLDANL